MAKGRGRWSEQVTDADYLQRVKSRVEVDSSGCWIWKGFVQPRTGYGQMSYRNKNWKIHRLMFKLAGGELQSGLDICHTCDKPACCNPEHLWQGTVRDNMLDASRKKRLPTTQKTQCPRGHEYSSENTYVDRRNGHTMRKCKICQRGRQRVLAGWSEEKAFGAPPAPRKRRPTSAIVMS